MKLSGYIILGWMLFSPVALLAQTKTGPFTRYPDKLVWEGNGEVIWIEPFGKDALRFRSTKNLRIADQDWTLLPQEMPPDCRITMNEKTATVSNGNIRAEIGRSGQVTYYNRENKIVLREERGTHNSQYARKYIPKGSDHFEMHVSFSADPNERLYGMGQYQIDNFNLKSTVLELAQRNTQISIPFLVSSKGYGVIWNNPAIGQAELVDNHTRFTASYARQLDYVVISKNNVAEVVRGYSELTGKAPEMPYAATGFWQSKLRYTSQKELLEVAREYKRRNLPISVIVADFYHWPHSGDWRFDERFWPDPKGMVDELHGMGIELLVSVWPTIGLESENYSFMDSHNYVVRNIYGGGRINTFADNYTFVDVTRPEARTAFWNIVKKNYFDKGVRMFWLDVAEPEFEPATFENLRYYQGNGLEVSCIYPFYYTSAFYEGQKAAGQNDIVNLARSGWIGSQRLGAVLWSGDINGDYHTFRKQIKAGLNISLCGIPWWNTDIGGFTGTPADPAYRELLVRWFQYGTFCPVMRLHGNNLPNSDVKDQLVWTGAPNEVWSFGEDVYKILARYLQVRESLRPYIHAQMKVASQTGDPMMRPMFYDFPEDEKTYDYDYQYMFGPDLLVAPVVQPDVREWTVYLPAGARWTDARTGKSYKGGQEVTLKVSLEDIPVFCKDGFKLNLKNY